MANVVGCGCRRSFAGLPVPRHFSFSTIAKGGSHFDSERARGLAFIYVYARKRRNLSPMGKLFLGKRREEGVGIVAAGFSGNQSVKEPLTRALSPSDGEREIFLPRSGLTNGEFRDRLQFSSLAPSDGERVRVRGTSNSIDPA